MPLYQIQFPPHGTSPSQPQLCRPPASASLSHDAPISSDHTDIRYPLPSNFLPQLIALSQSPAGIDCHKWKVNISNRNNRSLTNSWKHNDSLLDLKKKWTKQKLRKKIKDFLELNEKDIYLDLQNIMNIMKAQSTYISFIPESSTIKRRNHTQKSR